ncbi:putative ABC transporter permease [Bifidobacterium olomucense]|uniref:Transporter n=1 Tax=Bifidobacterium olomucense TaxID=2675324 RepID=A0A7Y0HX32_9BIFI|nr:putative ABC transporter permease [Bifidobacterium sp. DSM 109959]NMM98298.1 transporter [Bifidobacterium sp. DSM 109959]
MLFIEYLFLWFIFYSFVGWVYESILVSCQERRWVNRGFLNGPLCPIYGTGAVTGAVVLGNVHNPLAVFLISMVGASILEYGTSWAMEKLFHARWWDYSHFRFNIQGRICLLGAVIFGVGGVVIVNVVQPQVVRVTALIPVPTVHTLFVLLLVATVVDTVITVCGIVNFEQSLEQFKIAMVKAAKYGDVMREKVGGAADAASNMVSAASSMASSMASNAANMASGVMDGASERFGGMPGKVGEKVGESWQNGKEISAEFMLRVRDVADSMFNRQQRRMIASFPRLKTSSNNETLQQLRDMMERLHHGGK